MLPEFQLIRPLTDATAPQSVWLARRTADGVEFLAIDEPGLRTHWSPLGRLFDAHSNQTYKALLALLNHPNLISLAGVIHQSTPTATSDVKTTFMVWENPDAGTLAANMALYPRPPPNSRSKLFMPESLCWHVLRSLLCATAYLHDGEQFILKSQPDVITADPNVPAWPRLQSIDSDWMPILHRNINPENVWLQHPRGTETYGLVKLGGLDLAAVTADIRKQKGYFDRPYPFAPELGAEHGAASLPQLRVRAYGAYCKEEGEGPPPYRLNHELCSIAAVVFEMMTGFAPPPFGRCESCETYHIYMCRCKPRCAEYECDCAYGGCKHVPEPREELCELPSPPTENDSCNLRGRRARCAYDAELSRTRYSKWLIDAVKEIMCRGSVLSSDSYPPLSSVVPVLGWVYGDYSRWKKTTEEGRNTISADDVFESAWQRERMTEWQREANVVERARRAGLEMHEKELDRVRDLQDAEEDEALRTRFRQHKIEAQRNPRATNDVKWLNSLTEEEREWELRRREERQARLQEADLREEERQETYRREER